MLQVWDGVRILWSERQSEESRGHFEGCSGSKNLGQKIFKQTVKTLTTRRFHTHIHTLTQARARANTHKRNAVCTYVCIFASVFIKLYIDRPFQLERTQARVMTKIQFSFQKFYRKIFKMLKTNQESGSKELKCRIPRGMMSKFKCIVIFITYPIILA